MRIPFAQQKVRLSLDFSFLFEKPAVAAGMQDQVGGPAD
jgi:hypothetical protein